MLHERVEEFIADGTSRPADELSKNIQIDIGV